jgi:hypothetical protein
VVVDNGVFGLGEGKSLRWRLVVQDLDDRALGVLDLLHVASNKLDLGGTHEIVPSRFKMLNKLRRHLIKEMAIK